jgi:hypothetical protein
MVSFSRFTCLHGITADKIAPSYFSHFFSEQMHAVANRNGEVKTLYIDRDPATFKDIVLHLQGK